jgi:ATP-dependent Lhr-like helicase
MLVRYGILMRSLLERELPPFGWRRLFQALRLMELAGEVVGGHFIEGAPGPQFISREMARMLVQGLDRERIFFLNATDPASCCGLGLDWRGADLPARRPTNHLVYHGNRLVLVSRRSCRRLNFQVASDDSNIFNYLKLIEHILNHWLNGTGGVVIESINSTAAPQSPYLDPIKKRFEVAMTPNTVTVYRRWTS